MPRPLLLSEPIRVDWKCNLTYNIVVFASSGEVRVHCEDQLVRLQAGQALWIPIKLAHMVEHDENALGISILIPEKGLHTLGTERRIIEIPGSHRQWMFHLMLLTLSPLHSGQVTTDQIIHLLARFANAVPVSDSSPLKIPRHPIARRVAVDLLTSGNAPSRLEDFASRYGVSERTLRRVFAAESGVSFREFKKSASAKQMPSTLAHPVPALSTRWMNLLNNDVILWALRGRASIHLAPHTTSVGAGRTQRLQVGQLMLIPSDHSLRLEIEQGSLLFPLPLPPGSLPEGTSDCLPCQLPASYELPLLRRAISHITALRPLFFDPLDTLKMLNGLPNYPGLRMPRSPLLRSIAAGFISDVSASLRTEDVSGHHGLSLRQLQRRWPLETGMTVHRWRQIHRFQHAQALLSAGFSVNFVSSKLGYSDASSFAKAFESLNGYRPRTASRKDQSDIF